MALVHVHTIRRLCKRKKEKKKKRKKPQWISHCTSFDHLDMQSVNKYKVVFLFFATGICNIPL